MSTPVNVNDWTTWPWVLEEARNGRSVSIFDYSKTVGLASASSIQSRQMEIGG